MNNQKQQKPEESKQDCSKAEVKAKARLHKLDTDVVNKLKILNTVALAVFFHHFSMVDLCRSHSRTLAH